MGSINRPNVTQETASEQDPVPSSYSEDADGLSVSSRQRIRAQMETDIEAFLARGGEIQKLDITMSAEKLNQQ